MKKLGIGLLAAVLVGALAYAGGNWISASFADEVVLDQSDFLGTSVGVLNSVRATFRTPPLQTNIEMQSWLASRARRTAVGGREASDQLLDDLQDAKPDIVSAAVNVFYARENRALVNELTRWSDCVADSALTHLVTHIFQDRKTSEIGCVALAIQQLPPFTTELLNKNVELFSNTCQLCDEKHVGRITQSSRAIVLRCPNCTRRFDLLGKNLVGDYHRANEFLNTFVPDQPIPETKTRLGELMAVWSTVLDRCEYVADQSLDGDGDLRDHWQTPAETWNFKKGDCEDTSILLADWLISRDFQARVVVGKDESLEGHAWCIVRLDGEDYILESTAGDPNAERPPRLKDLADRYHPEFLFDRDAIYFPKFEGWTPEYWSADKWVRVNYAQPKPIPTAGETLEALSHASRP